MFNRSWGFRLVIYFYLDYSSIEYFVFVFMFVFMYFCVWYEDILKINYKYKVFYFDLLVYSSELVWEFD